jgi:DNA-binding MarR family transcriptional regulator
MGYYNEADFEPCRSVGYVMKRAHKIAHGLIEDRFQDLDLSFSQWCALALIRGEIVDTSVALARDLGHNSGATTRLVDSLDDRGLIRRERDEEDRRIVRLSLTEAGEAAGTALTPRVIDFWNEALEDFTADEVDQFVALLRRLTGKLEQLAAEEAA